MTELNIISATEQDLPEILQLQKDAYLSEAKIYNDYDIPPLKQDIDSIKNEFEKGKILKAMIGNELVGSVRAYQESSTCYIGKLIVKENQQNKGIGKSLMQAIESLYVDCNRFELFTGMKSEKNLHLYKKSAYTPFKEVKINDQLTMVFLEKIKN